MWSLAYSARAEKQLSKIDPQHRKIIVRWLSKNIDGCENPRLHGGELVGNHKGKWKYRIGSYRVLCDIQDESLVVLAIEVGHRREVYR